MAEAYEIPTPSKGHALFRCGIYAALSVYAAYSAVTDRPLWWALVAFCAVWVLGEYVEYVSAMRQWTLQERISELEWELSKDEEFDAGGPNA